MSDSKRRIVVKVGTSTLTHAGGRTNIREMERLVRVLSDIMNSGKQVVLVTSGAIGIGVGKLGLKEKPKDTPSKQAAATVGHTPPCPASAIRPAWKASGRVCATTSSAP